MDSVLLLAVPSGILGLAILVAVIRADKRDLPAIVRALMRLSPGDDPPKGDPPSLPGSPAVIEVRGDSDAC